MTMSRRRIAGLLALSLLALPGLPAAAQGAWPGDRPITWVVPYPPGGTTDILGRAIALRLGTSLGATVIVDNKAGATGVIGSAFVAKAAPDAKQEAKPRRATYKRRVIRRTPAQSSSSFRFFWQ